MECSSYDNTAYLFSFNGEALLYFRNVHGLKKWSYTQVAILKVPFSFFTKPRLSSSLNKFGENGKVKFVLKMKLAATVKAFSDHTL